MTGSSGNHVALGANIAATGADVHVAVGGRYLLEIVAGNFNGATVTLQRKAADGSYLTVGTPATASGLEIVEVAEGLHRIAITVAAPTGVYATLWSIT